MDMHGHQEGRLNKHESAKALVAEKLKSAAEVQAAVEAIGGHNLLKEGEIHRASEKGAWLGRVQSEVIDNGGAAIVIKEGDTPIGFVMVNAEGTMTQLRSVEGKEGEVIELARKRLKDAGFGQLNAEVNERGEHIRSVLHDADFEGKEISEEGRIGMKKE